MLPTCGPFHPCDDCFMSDGSHSCRAAVWKMVLYTAMAAGAVFIYTDPWLCVEDGKTTDHLTASDTCTDGPPLLVTRRLYKHLDSIRFHYNLLDIKINGCYSILNAGLTCSFYCDFEFICLVFATGWGYAMFCYSGLFSQLSASSSGMTADDGGKMAETICAFRRGSLAGQSR